MALLTVVGVGVDGPPGVDVVAGLDLRLLHSLRQQPHLPLLALCRFLFSMLAAVYVI